MGVGVELGGIGVEWWAVGGGVAGWGWARWVCSQL